MGLFQHISHITDGAYVKTDCDLSPVWWLPPDMTAIVVLTAVVQSSQFFTYITSWSVNVIINYRLTTSNSTHIA